MENLNLDEKIETTFFVDVVDFLTSKDGFVFDAGCYSYILIKSGHKDIKVPPFIRCCLGHSNISMVVSGNSKFSCSHVSFAIHGPQRIKIAYDLEGMKVCIENNLPANLLDEIAELLDAPEYKNLSIDVEIYDPYQFRWGVFEESNLAVGRYGFLTYGHLGTSWTNHQLTEKHIANIISKRLELKISGSSIDDFCAMEEQIKYLVGQGFVVIDKNQSWILGENADTHCIICHVDITPQTSVRNRCCSAFYHVDCFVETYKKPEFSFACIHCKKIGIIKNFGYLCLRIT